MSENSRRGVVACRHGIGILVDFSGLNCYGLGLTGARSMACAIQKCWIAHQSGEDHRGS